MPQPIFHILKRIIQKEIALEVNASGINSFYGKLMPALEILKLYKNLGGELIALGSDAHVPQNIANGFPETMKLLKETGFNAHFYYQSRQPQRVSLS